MATLDIQRLLSDADARIVAYHIGMKLFANGRPVENLDIANLSDDPLDSTYWTYCPFHKRMQGKEDRRPSNCTIHPKSIMCFAGCGSHKIIEMVCEFCGCSKGEGYEKIAEAMGGVELYLTDGKAPDYPKIKLGPEEQQALMLHPTHGTPLHLSMYDLFRKSKKEYYEMIEKRSNEMLETYTTLREQYASMDAPKAYFIHDLKGMYFDGTIYRQFAGELDKRIAVCEKLVKFFNKK